MSIKTETGFLNTKRILLLVIIQIALATSSMAWELYDLRCNGLKNPMGVDQENPTFSFKLKSQEGGLYLSSIYVEVATDSLFEHTVWSKTVITSKPRLTYQGKALLVDQEYYYKLQAESTDGDISPVEFGKFSTGIRGDFKNASWVSANVNFPTNEAVYFRSSVDIDQQLKKATLYLASGGPHELHFNGTRMFDQLLNPVFVDFTDHIPYNTYDVTDQLTQGENIMGIVLGNGWYNFPEKTSWSFNTAKWRSSPKMKFLLTLEYENGLKTYLESDENLLRYGQGILGYNSIYTGEVFNYDLSRIGWSTVEFDDRIWQKPISQILELPLTSQRIPAITIADTVRPVEIRKVNDHRYIAEFPFNYSGITSLNLRGEVGQNYTLQYAERYNEAEGYVDVSNLSHHLMKTTDDPLDLQQDFIYFSSGGEYRFTNSFNYKGFRYLQIDSNKPFSLEKEDVIGLFIYTKMEKTAHFSTDNELVNAIAEITERSLLSNYHGYPTDCPQREKNGWTGDGHLTAKSGLRLFDAAPLYEKWLRDHRISQAPAGFVPNIIPTDSWGYEDPQFDWTASSIIVTWELFVQSGDTSIIENNYPLMSDFMSYWGNKYNDDLIYNGYGDWMHVGTKPSTNFMSSALYFHVAQLMEYMSIFTSRHSQAEYYEELATRILNQINHKFLSRDSFLYGNGTATEQAMALDLGIVSSPEIKELTENLVRIIHENGNQPNIGVLGTKVLFSALAENGYEDLAFEIVNQEQRPSFGYIIANGATTLTENLQYNGYRYTGSQNHPYFGSIYDYFIENLTGFSESGEVGFTDFYIKPSFPKSLNHAELSIETKLGLVDISWHRPGTDLITYEVTIPPGSDMLFVPPKEKLVLSIDAREVVDKQTKERLKSGAPQVLKNGKYTFTIDVTKAPEAKNFEENGELFFDEGHLYFNSDHQLDYGKLALYTTDGKKVFDKQIDKFAQHSTRLSYVQNKLVRNGRLIIYFQSYSDQGKQLHILKLGIRE